MPDGIIKDDVPASAADGLSQQVMKLNIFDDDDVEDDDTNRSDDENEVEGQTKTAEEDDEEEDEIIQGLSNFSLDPQSEHREDEYTSKGPIR